MGSFLNAIVSSLSIRKDRFALSETRTGFTCAKIVQVFSPRVGSVARMTRGLGCSLCQDGQTSSRRRQTIGKFQSEAG